MPVFMCRWPNGDVSFVSARNREDATIVLDEFDNAELATLSKLDSFMLDFRLGDDGDLVLQSFGEECQSEIMDRAYPVLAKALDDAPRTVEGALTAKGKRMVSIAVAAEKKRTIRKTPKVADTELGKLLQKQLGASRALVKRRMEDVASRVLERLPTSGRKQ